MLRPLLACVFVMALLPLSVTRAAPGRPGIVLVHGAFADGSSWSRVIPLLQRQGYNVTVAQLPLTSLADDVAATRRAIERQAGDVILVGHSWAGVVVSEAGNEKAVKGIVYLSAMVPDSGESAQGMLERLHAPMDGMTPDANGLIWLDDPVAFRNVMGADLPSATARMLAAVGKPIAARSFSDAVGHAAWHDKPTWYLVTRDDHALPPGVQRQLARQIHARAMELGSSHLSLVAHLQAVAAFIGRATAYVGH